MRVSTTQIFQAGVSAMQRAQAEVNHTSLQLATGRRILTPSDDPSGAAKSLQLQAAIDTTVQHQRNGDMAKSHLLHEEAQLGAYGDILQRVRELVVAGSNDTYQFSDRKSMASELRQLRGDIFALANSRDANGEYAFAGTASFEIPFEQSTEGRVTYVGADGEGAVREVSITATRSLAVGDTGQSIFMEIPEVSGKVIEGVTGLTNRGDVSVEETKITDALLYEEHAGESLRIVFSDNAGAREYSILDESGAFVKNAEGEDIAGRPFDADVPIEFAGRRISLTGTPQDGDFVVSRPARYVSIFKTIDDVAKALETPVTAGEGQEVFSDAISVALDNISASMDRASEVRGTVGMRLQLLENHEGVNDQRIVDLETSLSEVRDLDYAEAISRFQLQEVVLQAAQQSYVQVSRLSLFDFL